MLKTNHLEIFAVRHCNLSCYACAQNSPLLAPRFTSLDLLEASLNVLKKYLRPTKGVVLGGEPLLHPQIDEILRLAKESNMFQKVCVTTNGLRLGSMTEQFWSNVDMVRVSIYPANHRHSERNWPEWQRIASFHRVELEERRMDSFQHIFTPIPHADPADALRAFKACVYKDYCHTLSEGILYRCSPVVFMDDVLAKLQIPERVAEKSALPVVDSPEFEERLSALLFGEQPIPGCRFCYGSNGRSFPHRQLTTTERAQINKSLWQPEG